MTKTALVTGGARGIGRACALALADSGFDIALVDLLEQEMAATAREIEARGRRTLTFQADVSDFARAHAIVEQINAKMGTARRAPEQCGRAEPETDSGDQRGRVRPHNRGQPQELLQLHSCRCSHHAEAGDRWADHLDVIDQRAVGRCHQRRQQACLCRGQGRHSRPHPVAGKGVGSESVGQCDLPGRDRDRPVARSARRAGSRARPPELRSAGSASLRTSPASCAIWPSMPICT